MCQLQMPCCQELPGLKLPSTLMFDHPTTKAIAAFATEQLAAAAAAPPPSPVTAAPMELEISFPGDFDSLSFEEKEEFKAQALKEICERTGLRPEDLEDLCLEPGSIIVKAKIRETSDLSANRAQATALAKEGVRESRGFRLHFCFVLVYLGCGG